MALKELYLRWCACSWLRNSSGGLNAHDLHIQHGQQDGDQPGTHGGHLGAHEVGQHEHHQAGADTGEGQIGEDALEALFAVGHPDHDKGDDQYAEHVEPAYHGGVQCHGGYAGVHQGRAAVDGGQALLHALPDQRIVDGHVLLEGGAGNVEVGKGQHQRPQQGHRSHGLGRFMKSEDAHQHHQDGAEGHHKIQEFHCAFSLSIF